MFSTRFGLRAALLFASLLPILSTGCPPAPPAPVGPTADFVVVREPIDFTVADETPPGDEAPVEGKAKLELNPEDPLIGFDPQLVQFVDQSDPGTRPITIWHWNFGDGATSDAQNPVHTYDKSGSFTVSLTVANGLGTDRITKTNLIQVNDRVGPQADFDYSPERGLDPLTVQFNDQSVAGVASISAWRWDFGDGGTSTIRNPRHEFRSLGAFDVSLTVTTAVGSDTFTKTAAVQVVPPLKVEFEPSVTSGKLPLSVSFSNLSDEGERTVETWQWDFGDGAISSARNPVHVYNVPGVYSVTLTANNGVRTDTRSRYALIEVIAPVAPVAQLAATPTNGNAPLAVLFRDRSTPGTAPITSWEWYFGDNLKQIKEEGEGEGVAEGEVEGEGEVDPTGDTPDSTEQNPIHVYRTPGTYTVTLVVRSEDGESIDTRRDLIKVFNPLAADFSADITSGLSPLSVQFTDLSDIGGGPVTARTWVFGDGATSNVANPLHVYSTPGVYDVRLSITTPEGTVTETKAAFVEVIAPVLPSADFSADVTTGPAPLVVTFENASEPGTGTDLSHTWDFGDNSTSAEENPTHTYERLGIYTVGLEVETSLGASSETKVDYVRAETDVLSAGGDAADRFRGIHVAADGSFAVAGSTRSFGDGLSQVFFSRYAADGNVIAQVAYPTTGNARAMDLVRASDGGFVLAGEIETPDMGLDMLVLKVDSRGNEIWRRAIGFEGDDRGTSIVGAGGGYLVAGGTDHPGNPDIFLARLDAEGNLLWTREIGGPSFDIANDVVAVPDGYWLTGTSVNDQVGGGSNIIVLNVDLAGNPGQETYFGGIFDDAGNTLAVQADGSLAISGVERLDDSRAQPIFFSWNPAENSGTFRKYDVAGFNEIFDLRAVPGDGYVLVGTTTSGDGDGLSNILLIRAAQNGAFRWARTLGGSGSEIGYAVGVNAKGEFLVTGQSDSFGEGSLDGIVIKTDGDGVQQKFPE